LKNLGNAENWEKGFTGNRKGSAKPMIGSKTSHPEFFGLHTG